MAASPVDEEAIRRRLGLLNLVGEAGYTADERVSARPTLEVNGIWGGFQGEGVKTVIPAEAHAKITCRLVPNQEPSRIIDLIAAHVVEHTPRAVTALVTPLPGGSRPYRLPVDHPAQQVAADVLTELYGKKPVYVWAGGTLPVCSLFQEILGADTVNLAFGLPDQRVHAPNEFCRLARFEQGQRAYCRFFEGMGERGRRC